jgi:4'-phosphopantetheinyl transferase
MPAKSLCDCPSCLDCSSNGAGGHHHERGADGCENTGAPVLSAPNLIDLPAGDIHLWFCFHGESDDLALDATYRSLLTHEELAQEARYHFPRDRRRHLLTRILVRTVLSRYASVPAQAWRFETGKFGRPSIAGPITDETDGLDFNLSHTDGLIVLGIARQTLLGIDVENACRPIVPAVIGVAFAPAEEGALQQLPIALQQQQFFDLWTLKESYIKARGMGLQIPLDRVLFTLTDTSIDLALDASLGDDQSNWRLWQLRTDDRHVVSVCAAHADLARMRIVCRDITRLQWECLRERRIFRSTHGDSPSVY